LGGQSRESRRLIVHATALFFSVLLIGGKEKSCDWPTQ
jgi:hypothetical protein